ncbi:MAG: DUF3352 domain-containing protein [Solirubrobacterales bacterium]
MQEDPRSDERDAASEPWSGIRPDAQLGADTNARSSLARRVRALRDSGPGSGTWSEWVRRRRRRLAARWQRLEATSRHRIAAGGIVAAVVLFVWLVLIPLAPCGLPGGAGCRPADDAIALVPDDALVYAHLDIDPESEQFAAASGIGRRVPLLSRLTVDAISGIAGAGVDYGRQIEPWAGGEVALAALPAGVAGQRVVMIEADDTAAAAAFASGLLGPKRSSTSVGDTDISVGPRGAAWAIEDGFLLIGSEAGLTAMLSDDRPALEGSDAAAVLDELPDDRLAYAFVSPAGARALLGSRALEPIDTFVDAGATDGAAASLSADDDGLRLAIRSDLDPKKAEASPSFFAALPAFTPTLTGDVGPATLAYLGLGDPGEGVGSLLDQARSSSPGLVAAFGRASRRLGKQAGIDIGEDLLPLLGSEAALTLQPVAAGGEPEVPGVTPDAGTPYVSLIARDVDPESARQALARLQGPVAKALAEPKHGGAPAFETIQIAGLQAQSLAVSPAVNLSYATWDDMLVITTDSLAIQQARSSDGGLDESEKFEDVTDGFPDSVSLIAYLDLTGLLNLGEQAGLATDPVYATYAPDLRTLTAAGLAVVADGDSLATDLRLGVGPAQAAETDASPLGGE